MDRFALFVDAGYFFSAGAHLSSGSNVPRKSVALKAPDKAVASLCQKATPQVGGIQLLRAYWYDAMPGQRLSLEQTTLAKLPYVKLRLGVLNNVGEQKGVDSLIVTDLIELARNRAISDAIIVSGDEDLRIAVQVAQSFGVRVHILAIGDPANNVSLSLQMESDSIESLDAKFFTEHLTISMAPVAPIVAVPVAIPAKAAAGAPGMAPAAQAKVASLGAKQVSLEAAAESVCNELLAGADEFQKAALKKHFAVSTSVPPEYDGRLIAKTSVQVGRKFKSDEMRKIRGIFVTMVRALPSP